MVSQVMFSTASSVNGSMRAVFGSGISSMSEVWMPFHPAIDDPSKACPSVNLSLVKYFAGTDTCCSLPRVSVKRTSTNFTSFSLIIFNTSSAVIAISNLLSGSNGKQAECASRTRHLEQNPCQTLSPWPTPLSARKPRFYPTNLHCDGALPNLIAPLKCRDCLYL